MRRYDFPPKKKSPLDDLYSTESSGGSAGGGPLDDLYATPAVATVSPNQVSPLDDLYAQGEPGAAAIASMENQNYEQNITRLKEILQKPGVSPAQRQRIEGMIKRYSEPNIRGFAVGNRVTDPSRSGASNLARGAGTGLINYGILGASDLLAGAAQLVLPKSWENTIALPQFRENVANSQQIVKELFDPQGYAGGAGTVLGAVGSGFVPTRAGSALGAVLKPFEVLNTAGFKALARVSPAAAAIVTKGTKVGAPFLSRLAAQAVGSATVDAVQIADVLTNDQLTTEQKIHAVVLAALASGGAGVYGALRAVKPTAAEIAAIKAEAQVKGGVKPPETPQAGADPARAAEAEVLAKKALESQEQAKINKRLTRGARAEWEAQNPTKDWKKDLTKEQQTDIITKYRARYSKSNISPEAAQPAATTGTPSSPPAEPPASPPPTSAPPPPPVEPPAAAGAGVVPSGAGEAGPVAGSAGAQVSNLAARVRAEPSGTGLTLKAFARDFEGNPPLERMTLDELQLLDDELERIVENIPLNQMPELYKKVKGQIQAGMANHPDNSGSRAAVAPRAGEVDPLAPAAVESPVDQVIEQLQAELAQTRQQRDMARRDAETDPMTGLGNQGAWQRAIATADADPNLEVVSFDLQNVKAANEILGRTEADGYIIDAARAIETAARANDAGARVFRYGGDEFAAIVPKGKGAQVLEDARRILGSSAAGEYPLGMRGAVGETAAQADAAVNAVKAGEKGPKYRKIVQPATVEQLVPGVELKKPLREHTVDELDAIYDKIDNLHDAGTITDEAYAAGIVAVSETKRQLKASGTKVESLEPAKKTKVDNAAAKDAGYPAGEYKTADPRVNEGHALIDGELKPVTREELERIKARNNARIAEIKDQPSSVAGEKEIRALKEETDRMTRQHARYNEANPSNQPPPRANPADVTGTAVQRSTTPLPESKIAPELRKVTDPNVFRRAFTARVDKMSLPDLEAHRDDLTARIQGLDRQTVKTSGYGERLAKVNEQIAKVAAGPGPGVILRTDPRVTGFAAGFALGFSAPADDDQTRWQHALYAGLVGAGIGHVGPKLLQRAKNEAVPDYQQEIRQHVRSVEDAPLEHRKGIYSFLLEKYGNIARRDIGITAVVKVAGGTDLPAGRNAGKLTEIYGLWRGMADRWLWGERVGTFDRDGNWVQFDSKTIQQIAGMVEGDLRTVGDLAAAKRELELRSMPEPRTTGLSLEAARKMYANTAEKYHLASAELTKFFRAMKDLSVMSGLLSKETSEKMDEQSFYVAIRRLFGDEPGTTPGVIDPKAKKKSKSVGPENLFKGLKGGKRPYQNPVEAAIELLPRYHRAAELNRLSTEFFDMLSAISSGDRALIGRRLSRAETPKIAGEDAKIQQLRDELASQGNHISETEAHAMVNYLSDESLNITNDVVRFYRNGEMEAWRVSEPLARAFRSLQPHELEAFMYGANILTKPTNLARVGITANPVFVGYQAIRDIWQYHMNGTYGLSPDSNPLSKVLQAPASLVQSGAYSMRGWLEIMFRTGEYRNYADVGSGGESVASQGLKTIRESVSKGKDILERVKEKPSKNQFDQIIKEVRTGNFREAYASILSPIADAGRVGAYLKERGRGADVIEAVYRAKKAGANFSNRGDALMLQALNRSTLFLNPAIQGLDASRYAFQKDPVGYMARGILGITIPSMMLWAAYKDDQEIVQLRGTPTGKKFWFFRVNGEIMKVPKPIFDGIVFGASAESYLDAAQQKDPDAVRNWAEGMYNDAAVNLLPFIAVAPISLMTGKIVGLGSELNPDRTSGLDVEYRARPDNTQIARIVSRAAGPLARKADTEFTDNALSPIGIDFLIQNYLGGFGAEVARGLSVAINLGQGGEMPVKQEMPFVRAAFGQYPSMNTAAIQEFYRHAERSEEALNTVKFLARSSPKDLGTYIETRLNEIMVAELYQKVRSQISDQRKALEDIRNAPREIMDDKTKRELTNLMMDLMIKQATQANSVARSINEAQSK